MPAAAAEPAHPDRLRALQTQTRPWGGARRVAADALSVRIGRI